MSSQIRKRQSMMSRRRLVKRTGRIFQQDYVLFLRAAGSRIEIPA